jgi:hypothetical protein
MRTRHDSDNPQTRLRTVCDECWCLLCSISAAFLQRLTHIAHKMRAMLGDVRTKASAMLRDHKKHGRLFTIDPTQQPSNAAANREVPGGKPSAAPETWAESTIRSCDPMTAPMMALSLLSNTNYLIDQGLHSLTLPRLPLMYPDDREAQDRCMDCVDGVCPLVCILMCV